LCESGGLGAILAHFMIGVLFYRLVDMV